MTARKVAVLKGGRSLERNVSLRSGAHAQEALARLGHEVVIIAPGHGSPGRMAVRDGIPVLRVGASRSARAGGVVASGSI